MKIFITLALCVYQAVIAFEYGQIFADIKICGTDKPAYPFCAVVDESPIDLTKRGSLDGDRLNCEREIDWDYNGQEEFEVEKKEHTIEVLVPHGVAEFDNPVDPVTSYNRVAKFCLEQTHFHWDDDDQDLGSEHAVDGKKYPLEAHFVHYNCVRGSVAGVQAQYPNQSAIDAARQQGRDVHELAVIGVFFKIKGNKANPAIDKILDAAELIYAKEKKQCKLRDISPDLQCVIDPTVLTPQELAIEEAIKAERDEILIVPMDGIDFDEILTDDILEGGYWTYEGSLTTPPCTDDVRWFNMKKESYISEAQWDRYRRITRPCKKELIAPNWRPLQENVNPVFSCQGRKHHRHHRPCDDEDGDNGDDEGDDDDSTKKVKVNGSTVKVTVNVDVKLPSDDNGDGDDEVNQGDDGDGEGNEGDESNGDENNGDDGR